MSETTRRPSPRPSNPPRRRLRIHGAEFIGSGARWSPQVLCEVAESLGAEPAALQALVEVETRGRGFDVRKRLRALYEGHVFNARTGGRWLLPEHARYVWRRLDFSMYGATPDAIYRQIDSAAKLDRDAALRAASWGLPQIMGFNHALAGYASPAEMIEDFKTGGDAQLRALGRFLIAAEIDRPLRMGDVEELARRFNGSAHARTGWAKRYRRA